MNKQLQLVFDFSFMTSYTTLLNSSYPMLEVKVMYYLLLVFDFSFFKGGLSKQFLNECKSNTIL